MGDTRTIFHLVMLRAPWASNFFLLRCYSSSYLQFSQLLLPRWASPGSPASRGWSCVLVQDAVCWSGMLCAGPGCCIPIGDAVFWSEMLYSGPGCCVLVKDAVSQLGMPYPSWGCSPGGICSQRWDEEVPAGEVFCYLSSSPLTKQPAALC